MLVFLFSQAGEAGSLAGSGATLARRLEARRDARVAKIAASWDAANAQFAALEERAPGCSWLYAASTQLAVSHPCAASMRLASELRVTRQSESLGFGGER